MNVTALDRGQPTKTFANDLSKLATDALDSIVQRQIAALLYKSDRHDMRVVLEELDPVSQQKYMNVAAMAMRQPDEQWHVPGLYAAIDAGDRFEGGTGIATMHKDVRLHELGRFEAALRAYRNFLAGLMPAMVSKAQACAEFDRKS